jgi:hypothetical protein
MPNGLNKERHDHVQPTGRTTAINVIDEMEFILNLYEVHIKSWIYSFEAQLKSYISIKVAGRAE